MFVSREAREMGSVPFRESAKNDAINVQMDPQPANNMNSHDIQGSCSNAVIALR